MHFFSFIEILLVRSFSLDWRNLVRVYTQTVEERAIFCLKLYRTLIGIMIEKILVSSKLILINVSFVDYSVAYHCNVLIYIKKESANMHYYFQRWFHAHRIFYFSSYVTFPSFLPYFSTYLFRENVFECNFVFFFTCFRLTFFFSYNRPFAVLVFSRKSSNVIIGKAKLQKLARQICKEKGN